MPCKNARKLSKIEKKFECEMDKVKEEKLYLENKLSTLLESQSIASNVNDVAEGSSQGVQMVIESILVDIETKTIMLDELGKNLIHDCHKFCHDNFKELLLCNSLRTRIVKYGYEYDHSDNSDFSCSDDEVNTDEESDSNELAKKKIEVQTVQETPALKRKSNENDNEVQTKRRVIILNKKDKLKIEMDRTARLEIVNEIIVQYDKIKINNEGCLLRREKKYETARNGAKKLADFKLKYNIIKMEQQLSLIRFIKLNMRGDDLTSELVNYVLEVTNTWDKSSAMPLPSSLLERIDDLKYVVFVESEAKKTCDRVSDRIANDLKYFNQQIMMGNLNVMELSNNCISRKEQLMKEALDEAKEEKKKFAIKYCEDELTEDFINNVDCEKLLTECINELPLERLETCETSLSKKLAELTSLSSSSQK